MTFKELKAAVKGRFLNWGKYAAEKLEAVSGVFDGTTSADAGKVLTVGEDGSAVWSDPVSELPSSTSADEGKVLTVGDDGSAEWSEPATELPPYTSSDVDKVLGLAEGEAQTVTVVPEQTGALTNLQSVFGIQAYGFEVAEFDNDFFSALEQDDVVHINWIYNDNTVGGDLSCIALGTRLFVYPSADNAQYALLYKEGHLYAAFYGTTGNGTIVATASVPSVSPAWVLRGLPAITEYDYGNVLTVAEDENHNLVPIWAQAGAFYVSATTDNGSTFSVNTTATELMIAFLNQRRIPIISVLNRVTNETKFVQIDSYTTAGGPTFAGTIIVWDVGRVYAKTYTLTLDAQNDTIAMTSSQQELQTISPN